MIFNSITFENYRPFYSVQTIDLHRKSEEFSPYKKNITLIGGLNGAGKTSLINAIFICLYGKRMFSKSDYDNLKKEAINHRFLREGGKESNIKLSFTDDTGTYIIHIRFQKDLYADIFETRNIYVVENEKDRPVTTAEEEFNDFIDQRIPIDVAPFFIFDAENIKELVGDHNQNETIKAIQKIVSLELYKTSYEDLKSIRTKDEKNMVKAINDDELNKLMVELQNCSNELENLKSKEKPDDKRIEYLKNEKMALEQNRRRKMANNSQTKGQIYKSIGEIENELNRIQTTLERFGKTNLPNIIVASLVKQLQARLKKEQSYKSGLERNNTVFAPYENFIKLFMNIPIDPPLIDEQKDQFTEKGKSVWAQINSVQQVKLDEIEILHYNDLSQNEFQFIMNWNSSNSIDINSHINQRIKFNATLSLLNNQLNEAPDVIDTKAEDDELAKISEELGALYSVSKSRRESLTRLNDRHHQLSNDLTRKRLTKKEMGPLEQKMDMLTRLMGATNEFISKVTILKARQLKDEIDNSLSKLFRKNDINRVEFDPEQFILKIYDAFDNQIALNSRSEGEKQLIALSMIWALTKVSRADFPFVIDTPLARLDSIHRSNLVNRFFTNLSDQVIILTTDTEITKEFLEEIKPYVQISYLLEYNVVENSTTVSEGYFQFE